MTIEPTRALSFRDLEASGIRYTRKHLRTMILDGGFLRRSSCPTTGRRGWRRTSDRKSVV